jgi:hypothetical protein
MADSADRVMWKSVLGAEVPPKPIEWEENRIVDAPRYLGLIVSGMALSLGLVFPVVLIPILFLLGLNLDYWTMFPVFPLVYGIPFAVIFAYLAWRVVHRTAESLVGVRADGVAVRDKKGRVKWIPVDSINHVSPLYYSPKGECLVMHDMKAFGNGRALIVKKDIAMRITGHLENAGYTVTSQGLVGRTERTVESEMDESEEPVFVTKESRAALASQVNEHGGYVFLGVVLFALGVLMTYAVLSELLTGGTGDVWGVLLALGLLGVSIPLTRYSFIRYRRARKKLRELEDGLWHK